MSTVLITGATGFLGPYLMEAFRPLGRVVGVARSSAAERRCDVTDAAAVKSLLDEVRPDVVIHAAALTDVDLCQKDSMLAKRTNRDAIATLVENLPAAASLVYVSTDQVYPGNAALHAEGSEAPVNVYGASKLAGEAMALRHVGALVLRTNLFGVSQTQSGASLVDFLVEKFRSREPVSLFTDVLFSPLHVKTVAALMVECVRRKLTGTFNLGSRDGMSKCDFALAVARHLGLPTENATPALSTSLPARAPRPLDMRMDTTRIERALGIRMPALIDEVKKL